MPQPTTAELKLVNVLSGLRKETLRRFLILSSSLLTDRMLRYSDCLPALRRVGEYQVWATSQGSPSLQTEPTWKTFPTTQPFREFPYNYLRRLNEFAWDYRLKTPSRLSMIEHVRNRSQGPLIRALKVPGRVLALAGLHLVLENMVNRYLLSYPRSPEARERLREFQPNVLIATGPHRFDEPAVVAEAVKLRIPVLALMTSWDNLTTKGRILFDYGGYLVWSEQMRQELHHLYPRSKELPIYVVGAPQFDVFFQERFEQSREDFCRTQGLDPTRPYVLYALGSPNFLKEHHGVVELSQHVTRGELGNIQVLVRPHPLFDNGKEATMLRGLSPNVIVQNTGQVGKTLTSRTQNESQIKEWVNTLRHAAAVVNLSSTMAIDAALFNKPVVNLDFDPEPGQPNQALVKDVNHLWSHFKPIAESGGVWLANDMGEVVQALRKYLANPALHEAKRRWIAEYVCGYLDGRSGQRIAQACIDFVRRT